MPVTRIAGRAIPFGQANVDTDIIIPAEHLKTISRVGLGRFAFETLRSLPDNLFNRPENVEAPILIAGDNFGCGSSREHAVWALMDMGVRAVIAPSFSDIFSGNAFKNGMVTVALPQAVIDRLLATAAQGWVEIDLDAQAVTTSAGDRFGFDMDAFRRECLMEGRDEIGLTLMSEGAIDAYEAQALQLGWQMTSARVA